MQSSKAPIDWESHRIFSQIAEEISRPLSEIVRLNQYILGKTDQVDHETKQISSIILESSQQIENLIEDILKIEKENTVQVFLRNRFRYPDLYKIDFDQLNSGLSIESNGIDSNSTRVSEADLEWLSDFESKVAENLSSSELSISWLGSECATSERQIFRRVKKYTGLTPQKYIRTVRLFKAKELLESYIYSTVNEVARTVGIRDPHYFSKLFKAQFGVKPIDYFG